jgi:hypothetical protein
MPEDKDSQDVIKSMSGYSVNVVTLTMGDELSGQIVSYVAGASPMGIESPLTKPVKTGDHSNSTKFKE